MVTLNFKEVTKAIYNCVNLIQSQLTVSITLKSILPAALILAMVSCSHAPKNVAVVLNSAGSQRVELMKVINHYKSKGNDLKLRAAYYLIANLPGKYHYEGQGVQNYRQVFNLLDKTMASDFSFDRTYIGDSIKHTIKKQPHSSIVPVDDLKTIKAQFLIENIDDAFVAWSYPWASDLSFEDFCEYLLPYKLKNEEPERWRPYFQKRYKWIIDSLNSNADPLKVCELINNDLKKWFYFSKTSLPFDPSCKDLLTIKAGKCPEEVQITTYAMRAMGLPVSMDYVPLWANRNSSHDWNCLILKGKPVAFLGTEIGPGNYKVEFAMPGSIAAKRAKIYRYTFAELNDQATSDYDDEPRLFRNKSIKDVTADYLPVSRVRVKVSNEMCSAGYLCVFNNLEWRPIARSVIESKEMIFDKMGRGIVYLPAYYIDNEIVPAGQPILLKPDGEYHEIVPQLKERQTVVLTKKYPAGDDNKIFPKEHYELFYWNKVWVSLGKQIAQIPDLTYSVPINTLLWLHNFDKGSQERIFIVDKNKQLHWY